MDSKGVRRVKKYLEVVSFDDSQVVRRYDITEKTDRYVEKLESGLLNRIDLNNYFTSIIYKNEELPELG